MATKRTRVVSPVSRPHRMRSERELKALLELALRSADGITAAHCVHEIWMRGAMAAHVEALLAALWKTCAATVPDWLPMRHIEWLPKAYDVAAQFKSTRGRSNIYLILLDYSDSRTDPYGVYVGMSEYSPLERFDQHKAGIRAAGSVLKRGLEPLLGPTLHLQGIKRANAAQIEVELAEALTTAGIVVQGGH